ncbi:hypothetical protein PIB30_021877 [Stylosanthes scabra]|uniref:Uncharacterized protein n=1 Tax=Stylosanthes scabra TaxID=79078 RepID=A0ABU6R9H9_9FABA|nr:hypothetical protein [Stylosanthes scabra]
MSSDHAQLDVQPVGAHISPASLRATKLLLYAVVPEGLAGKAKGDWEAIRGLGRIVCHPA